MRTEPGAPLLGAGWVCASSSTSSPAEQAGREVHKVLLWETHRSATAHRDALRVNVSFAAASPYGSGWLIAKISREQGPGEITMVDTH